MRAFLGEYGRIILCGIAISIIFVYAFSLHRDSVAGSLPEPDVKVKSEDSFALVDDVSKRTAPVFSVTKHKLQKNTIYDLESIISAANADGASLAYTVTKLEYPDGTVKEGDSASNFATAFFSRKAGEAKVTCKAAETYKGRELVTEETFLFLVD